MLFDLGCGNGALAAPTVDEISKYHRVDYSEYLIKIAKENFEKSDYTFEYGEAFDYLNKAEINSLYTKGLYYGAFCYFKRENVPHILKT